MILILATAVGIYFLMNVETIAVPLLGFSTRVIAFQGEYYHVSDELYFGVFILTIVLGALSLKKLLGQNKEPRNDAQNERIM